MGIVRESIIESKFSLSLSKLAADCFTVRNSGTSLSMVITGRSCYYCVNCYQSICYKLVASASKFYVREESVCLRQVSYCLREESFYVRDESV